MKIKVEFGMYDGSEIINWYRDISDFPKLLRYQGSVYEFAMYTPDTTLQNDYIFTFSQTSRYRARWEDIPVFKDMFGPPAWNSTCQCGSKYDKGNPKHHYEFCPKYKPKKD